MAPTVRSMFPATLCIAFAIQIGTVTPQQVVNGYVIEAAAAYERSCASASTLLATVRELCRAPTPEHLETARAAWCRARADYGLTEVYRYGDGPIDARRGGVETFVNAWPADEAYIEPETPDARTGIIADRARYPLLARAVLREHNQRGGETNVCTGWHAIEFMLWGRDASEAGPGSRPASDFVDGTPNADRRREFLLEITTLLCEDLAKVSDAWKPGTDNHRARFVANQPRALRSMFIGPALLASYEMAGERLTVALETRDQEEEPSCFSDTTDADFKADLGGIERVLRGTNGQPGLIDLVRTRNAAQADALADALANAVSAVQAMPHPFDAAVRASDETAQRKAMVAAQQALERLGAQVSASAKTLDIELPTEPRG